MKNWPRRLWNGILISIPLLFITAPLLLWLLLYLGWPPVIGNLTAARAMTVYAAQAHPNWKPEGIWAGYNLEDDGYYLDFANGHSLRYDRDRSGGLVHDKSREAVLRENLEIDRTIQINGLYTEDHYVYWGASWRPKDPDTPYIHLRVDCYDPADAPILEESPMREQMADHALEAYAVLSPLAPVAHVSVHYCHQGVKGKDPGLVWKVIGLDLPKEAELTREDILTAPLTVK